MLLGHKHHTAGNATFYGLDYSDWLEPGMTLSGPVTVTLDPAFTATVTDIVITDVGITPSNHLTFLLTGGSVNEAFTLNIQARDSRGEVKNDTIAFTVAKP